MKRTILLTTLLVLFLSAKSQVNIINIDPNRQKESNEYFINGISTREDIGGVEVSTERVRANSYTNYTNELVYFENYRDVPVTVIYELFSGPGKPLASGSCILKAGERKYVANLHQHLLTKSILIVRKL